MTKEAKIQVVRGIIIAGFVFSALLCLAMRLLLHRGFPYATFLFDPHDRFNDFFHLEHIRFHPYEKRSVVGNYFPLFYVLLIAVSVAGSRLAFALYTLGFLAFFLAYAWRHLQTGERGKTLVNTLVFTFLSYPVLFTLDRGNAEMWEFVLMCGYVFFYRRLEGMKAGLLLGVAGSLKPFPLLFLMLPAAERRWRDPAVCLAAATVLSVVSLRCLGPNMAGNFKGLLLNLDEYNRAFATQGDAGLFFGHSLFGLLKSVLYAGSRQGHDMAAVGPLATGCLAFAVAAVAGLTVFMARVEMPFWKKTALVILAMDLLPLVSADYKRLDFYIPLFLFLNAEEKDAHDRLYAVLFGLLLIPKAVYPLTGSLFSLGVVVNPLLMMAMAALVIGSGLKARRPVPVSASAAAV